MAARSIRANSRWPDNRDEGAVSDLFDPNIVTLEDIPIWRTYKRVGDQYVRCVPPPGRWASFDNSKWVRDDRGCCWRVFEVDGKLWRQASML